MQGQRKSRQEHQHAARHFAKIMVEILLLKSVIISKKIQILYFWHKNSNESFGMIFAKLCFTSLKIILQTHKQLQIHDFYDYYYHFLSQSSLSRFSLFSKFSKKKITMCQIVLTILTFWLLVDFNPHGPNASKYIQIVAHHHGKMNEYFVDPTLISTLLQNDVKLQHYVLKYSMWNTVLEYPPSKCLI